ncbi:MAG: RNA methyltransferase [Alistipes sp.]|nr:RNA methyltransferase [Alistipes sp.]
MTNTANRDAAWFETRIACLEEFMTPERAGLFRRTVAQRTRYMTLLAENTFHPQNAAALIRHCEAFGVQRMHTVESFCEFRPAAAVVRGTDRWVDVCRHPSSAEALRALKAEGYRIVCTTPHREDATPETFDVSRGPFALVFGTEHAGISDEAIAAADEFLRIPMCGMVESLNVSASAAILIYQLSQRVRQQVGEWAMTPQQQTETLYGWMYRSVADAAQIFNRRFGDGPQDGVSETSGSLEQS